MLCFLNGFHAIFHVYTFFPLDACEEPHLRKKSYRFQSISCYCWHPTREVWCFAYVWKSFYKRGEACVTIGGGKFEFCWDGRYVLFNLTLVKERFSLISSVSSHYIYFTKSAMLHYIHRTYCPLALFDFKPWIVWGF